MIPLRQHPLFQWLQDHPVQHDVEGVPQFGYFGYLPPDSADFGPTMVPYTNTVGTVMTILSVLFVVARLVSRRMSNCRFDLADGLLCFGCLCVWADNSLLFVAGKHGLGRHLLAVSFDNLEFDLKLNFAAVLIYAVALLFIRLSILLLYLSVFRDKAFRIACGVALFFVLAHSLTIIGLIGASCRPINAYWDLKIIDSVCINVPKAYWATAIANVCIDSAMLFLPIVNVARLELTMRQKISVIGVFATGGLVCIVSGVRIHAIEQWDDLDATWDYTWISTWSIIELNLFIVSACLPTLRPLAVFVFRRGKILEEKVRGTFSSTSKDGKDYVKESKEISQRSEDLSRVSYLSTTLRRFETAQSRPDMAGLSPEEAAYAERYATYHDGEDPGHAGEYRASAILKRMSDQLTQGVQRSPGHPSKKISVTTTQRSELRSINYDSDEEAWERGRTTFKKLSTPNEAAFLERERQREAERARDELGEFKDLEFEDLKEHKEIRRRQRETQREHLRKLSEEWKLQMSDPADPENPSGDIHLHVSDLASVLPSELSSPRRSMESDISAMTPPMRIEQPRPSTTIQQAREISIRRPPMTVATHAQTNSQSTSTQPDSELTALPQTPTTGNPSLVPTQARPAWIPTRKESIIPPSTGPRSPLRAQHSPTQTSPRSRFSFSLISPLRSPVSPIPPNLFSSPPTSPLPRIPSSEPPPRIYPLYTTQPPLPQQQQQHRIPRKQVPRDSRSSMNRIASPTAADHEHHEFYEELGPRSSVHEAGYGFSKPYANEYTRRVLDQSRIYASPYASALERNKKWDAVGSEGSDD